MEQLAQYTTAPSCLGKIWRKFDYCCCDLLHSRLLACYFTSLLHKSKPQTMQIVDEESDS